MVRIKERYLLVNILYPRDGTPINKNPGDGKDIPDFVAIRHATQSELTPQLLLRAVKAETLALFGDCGAGAVERTLSSKQASLTISSSLDVAHNQVKYFNRATSTFILRITRDHFRLVWTALTFMNCVPVRDGPPCVYRVARVSGTIRKVEEEAIRQARALILATKEYMAGNTTSAFELLTQAREDRQNRNDLMGAVVSDDNDGDEGTDDDVEVLDDADDDMGGANEGPSTL